MSRSYVGFGFGPIQSALFLYEAHNSGNFDRFIIAEVDQHLVDAVNSTGGSYTVNIARSSGIDQATIRGVQLVNPRSSKGRAALVEAIAASQEIATCLPSVTFYDTASDSAASIVGEGIGQRTTRLPTIVYAAENHNHAAEILRDAVARHTAVTALGDVQFLNTVIGKMSGIITDTDEIRRLGLATLTPQTPRAVLVEEFNRILISRIELPGFRRGITVFSEKPDLLPFEEAKLYGHNAIHAMIGYLAQLRGLRTMAQAAGHADLMHNAREAFLHESGAALIRRHTALGDPLFTPDGYRAYADDLLQRMINPHLNDLVARVVRDPHRKLGYDDRLYGTMRLALEAGIKPAHLATGAAAAVRFLSQTTSAAIDTRDQLASTLRSLWGASADHHADQLIELTWRALQNLG